MRTVTCLLDALILADRIFEQLDFFIFGLFSKNYTQNNVCKSHNIVEGMICKITLITPVFSA